MMEGLENQEIGRGWKNVCLQTEVEFSSKLGLNTAAHKRFSNEELYRSEIIITTI